MLTANSVKTVHDSLPLHQHVTTRSSAAQAACRNQTQRVGIADTILATRAANTLPTREEYFLSDVNMLNHRKITDRQATLREGCSLYRVTCLSVLRTRSLLFGSRAVSWSSVESCCLLFQYAYERLQKVTPFTQSSVLGFQSLSVVRHVCHLNSLRHIINPKLKHLDERVFELGLSIVESAVPGVTIIAESVQSGTVVLLRLGCQSLQLVQVIVGNV